MRKLIVYTAAFLLLALLIVPAVMAADLVVSTDPAQITVHPGEMVDYTIYLTATGSIAKIFGASNPATATVTYSSDGTNTVMSSPFKFYASSIIDGTSGNYRVTWDGSPAAYMIKAKYKAPMVLGNYPIKIAINNPKGSGGKLDYNSASSPIIRVTAPPDTTPPVITVANVLVEGNVIGGWKGVVTATVTDTIDPSPKLSNGITLGYIFPVGTTPVIWTATDASGNTATATQTVTVIDTTKPTITAPVDVTKEGNTIGGLNKADIGTASATDIVDASPVVGNDAPNIIPVGTQTVTWTAKDFTGNIATATQKVTVTDTTPPTITAPDNVTKEGNTIGGYSGDIGTATAFDTVDGSRAVTNDAPNLFPVGKTTTVTYTSTDASGNTATATQTVTVIDTKPPVITAPDNVTIEGNTIGGYSGDIGTATAFDTVDGSRAVTNDALTLFPVGKTTTVTYTSTDASGNTATATQTVTVIDTKPPVITAPHTLTYLVNTPSSVLTGLATAADIVDPNPVVTFVAPDLFPAGESTVTWTATDASGNSATATTTIVTGNYNFVNEQGSVISGLPRFLEPVNINGKSFQHGSNVPVKFKLNDNNGPTSTAVATLWIAPISSDGSIGGYSAAITKEYTGNKFYWDGSQYHFNLDTDNLSIMNYEIQARLDSGQTIETKITIK